jgi:hypothetical protein
VAGRPATLQVNISAAATTTADFQLVTEGGETIRKVPMQAGNSNREKP